MTEQKIVVTEGGPYRVEGGIPIRDHEGNPIEAPAVYFMCRCGGSKSKPFCDGTHNKNNFNGLEFASRDTAAQRRKTYIGNGITIYDDRSRCAHAGFCTDNLPAVFESKAQPWIRPLAASAEDIKRVISMCPSGALSYTIEPEGEPVEVEKGPGVTVAVDSPYWVRGVQVVSENGKEYDLRERQTLCRCGGSANKPFCDGTHWYMGFKHQMGDKNSFKPKKK